MAPARLAAFEARDPERWEIYSFEKGKLELSADYEGRLRANEKAGTSSSPSRLGTGGRRRTG